MPPYPQHPLGIGWKSEEKKNLYFAENSVEELIILRLGIVLSFDIVGAPR